MGRISRNEVEVGMKLACALHDRQGHLLIAQNTELTEKHIRALKLWGFSSVDVYTADDHRNVGATPEVAVSADAMERANEMTADAFRHNAAHKNHPLFTQLFSFYLARLSPELTGKEPPPPTAAAAGQAALGGKAVEISPLVALAVKRVNLNDLMRKTETVASLPAVYDEIVKVVNDPRSSANDVANVISSDSGLTARLLRLVNSAFYGFPGGVETVTRATTLAGMNELSQLALATSVLKVFNEGFGKRIDMSAFWRHSLCCGVVARLLAEHQREPNSERHFVTGLLHDIGRLVIMAQLPLIAPEALRIANQSRRPLWMVEHDLMGFSHADVGRALLEKWNLPAGQQEAVACHHAVSDGSQHAVEIDTLHVANVIAHVMRIGRSGELVVSPLEPRAWDRLGLSPDILPALIQDAEMQVRDLAGVFDLGEEP